MLQYFIVDDTSKRVFISPCRELVIIGWGVVVISPDMRSFCYKKDMLVLYNSRFTR